MSRARTSTIDVFVRYYRHSGHLRVSHRSILIKVKVLKMDLSKSQYIRGLQCVKSLWLKKQRPDVLSEPDETAQAVFETGNMVGAYACGLFPGGIEIPFDGTTFQEKIALTKQLIDEGVSDIYEATFEYDGILVMVDILHRSNEGWEVYEVKSSTKVSDVYIDDASVQYYVLKGSGLDVKKVSIVHLDNQYVRGDTLEIEGLFFREDVTEAVLERQDHIPSQLTIFKGFLDDKEKEPDIDIEIGAHCTKPYTCDAYDYCWKRQREIPDYSVFDIFNMGRKPIGLYRRGIVKVEDIPDEYLTTDKQKLVVDAYKHDLQIIDRKPIRSFLDSLTYPIYHLDFETFQQAIPEIEGTRPFQQIPFQYSLHIEHEDGRLEHFEFLGDEESDPREALVISMIEQIPQGATVMVFNESFEKTRIKELARDFPMYAEPLMKIRDGIVDLALPFSRRHYYHPELRGKYSIKVVLPHLVPEMAKAYKELELVQNGSDAMNTFPRLKTMGQEERDRYRSALLRYCELDTLAMVRVLARLRSMVI